MVYLILGIVFMLIIDIINIFYPQEIHFNFIDRVILILIWPISLGVFLKQILDV